MSLEENKEQLEEEQMDYDAFDDEERRPMEEEEEDPKKDKVIQNKLVFLLLCLLMFSLPLLWFFGMGNPVNADEILVGDIVELDNGKLESPLMIGTGDSATVFTITTQEVEENILILKPRFSLAGIYHSDHTVVESKVPAAELSEIWIQGDDENDRQRIWVNEEK